ncbi:glycoside hydrolase family 28 protein [Bacteroides sp. 214]|uniref:glycoside hydrolase family 28 protein n=1 Tax=Bacteroides sp. 214 TaxID=2302935 RepID=UPI001EF19ED9|nr:glycoside hydrolase family 28 protein [Bacteroides sp. 214]
MSYKSFSAIIGYPSILSLLFLLSSCHTTPSQNISIPAVHEVGAHMMPQEIAPITGAPFDMPVFQKKIFPDVVIDISQRGAVQGELITPLINNLIQELSANGGGTVFIPSGKWTSGRIILKSNINLHLSEDAEITFSGNVEDYLPALFTRHEGIEIMGPGGFIYANGEENIAITGKGTLWGPPMDAQIRHHSVFGTVIENIVDYRTPVEERVYDGIEGRRVYLPKSIAPINCRGVLIEGITLNRSVFWNICPIYCEDVIIRGITVNSVEVASGDGIDIESCKNVLIEYCTLNNGDDCFTIKAGRTEDGLRVGKPSENIVVRYSLAQNGHGAITCGSETAGGIKNLYAHDCVFHKTDRGIRFKTRRNRGGGVDGVWCERIRMIDVKEAFTWDLLGSTRYVGDLALRYPPREITPLTPVIKNIHAKQLLVESSRQFIRANCIPEIPLSDVTIEDSEIHCERYITALNDVNGFTLRNLRVTTKDSTITKEDAHNLLFENVVFLPNRK